MRDKVKGSIPIVNLLQSVPNDQENLTLGQIQIKPDPDPITPRDRETNDMQISPQSRNMRQKFEKNPNIIGVNEGLPHLKKMAKLANSEISYQEKKALRVPGSEYEEQKQLRNNDKLKSNTIIKSQNGKKLKDIRGLKPADKDDLSHKQ